MTNPNDVLAGVDDAAIRQLMGALAEYQAQRQTRAARQSALASVEAKLAHYRQLRTALALLQAEIRAADAGGLTLPVLWSAPAGNGKPASPSELEAARAQATALKAQAQTDAEALLARARAQADELLRNGRGQADDLLTSARGEAATLMARARKALQDAEAAALRAAPDTPPAERRTPGAPPRPRPDVGPIPAAPEPQPVPVAPESPLLAATGPGEWEEFRHSTSTAFEAFTVQRGPAQLTVEALVNEEGALTGVTVTLTAEGETDARVCAIRRALPADGGVPLLKGMAFTLAAGACRARLEAGSDLRVGQSQALALHLRYQLITPAGEAAPAPAVSRPPAAQPDQMDRAAAEAPAVVSPALVGLVQSEDGF